MHFPLSKLRCCQSTKSVTCSDHQRRGLVAYGNTCAITGPLTPVSNAVHSDTVTPNSRRSGNSKSETESRPIHTAKELHCNMLES